MRDILMSIKPEYSQAILRGDKTVEFRRVFSDAAAATGRVIIYESAPTMKIVGCFEIEKIDQPLRDTMDFTKSEQVVANCIRSGCKKGIQAEALLDYLLDAKTPCAIYLKNVIKLDYPFSPKESDPNFRPPQSYMWCPDWLSIAVHTMLKNQGGGTYE